jgi:DNA-binding sugar fermentation-stimulating protein
MAKKGKKQVFSAIKAVKSAARQQLGMPLPTKVVPDAKTKAARRGKKHKPDLQKLLENGERS